MGRCMCRRAPGSSPTRCRKTSGRKPAPRRARCYGLPRWRWGAWMPGGSMILMIDNYDSFTWNLVQYLGELGAEVKVFRNDEIAAADIAAMRPEGIVISPGPCTPTEAGISLDAVREFAGQIPILGVCLGHQAIGQAFGGEVVHA